MMNLLIFIIILSLPILYSFVSRSPVVSIKLLDRNQTTALRGISILMVIIAHFGQAMGSSIFGFLGGIGVSIFLILSGYGLNESFKKRGLLGFWKKKLLRVMLPYWLVLLIILLFCVWREEDWSLKKLLLDMLGIKTSYWYIGFIVRWYIIFYIYKLLPHKIGLILMFSYSIYVLITYPEHINIQFLSFPLGVLISNHICNLQNIQKRRILYFALFCFSLGVLLFIIYYKILGPLFNPNKIFDGCYKGSYYIMFVLFIICMVHLYPKIFISSYLIFIGNVSYELYLVHMQFLNVNIFIDNNINIFSWKIWIISYVASLILSISLKYIHGYFVKYLKFV